MPRQENELILEEKNGTIYLILRLTFKRRNLWTLIILLSLVLAAIGSSLDEDARKVIIDLLIGAMQLIVFIQRHPKS